jgi:hypothetical protein
MLRRIIATRLWAWLPLNPRVAARRAVSATAAAEPAPTLPAREDDPDAAMRACIAERQVRHFMRDLDLDR